MFYSSIGLWLKVKGEHWINSTRGLMKHIKRPLTIKDSDKQNVQPHRTKKVYSNLITCPVWHPGFIHHRWEYPIVAPSYCLNLPHRESYTNSIVLRPAYFDCCLIIWLPCDILSADIFLNGRVLNADSAQKAQMVKLGMTLDAPSGHIEVYASLRTMGWHWLPIRSSWTSDLLRQRLLINFYE